MNTILNYKSSNLIFMSIFIMIISSSMIFAQTREIDSALWGIEDFLLQRRKVIDWKYDYRYSRLIVVFSLLLRENYLSKDDICELHYEKKEIKKISIAIVNRNITSFSTRPLKRCGFCGIFEVYVVRFQFVVLQ